MFASAVAQTPDDPGDIVDEYTRLNNEGDIDGALQLLAGDVVIIIGPCLQAFGPDGCVGKEQVSTILRAVNDAGARLTVLNQSVDGSTVTQRREVTSEIIRRPGVDRIIEDVSDSQTETFFAAQRMQPPSTGSAGLLDQYSASPFRALTRNFAAWLLALITTIGIASLIQRLPRARNGLVRWP